MKSFIVAVGLLFCITISSADEEKCTPGSKWIDHWGSRCECMPEGYGICTPVSKINVREVLVDNQWGFDEGTFCDPGKQFMLDCNTCTCNAEGNGAQCTTDPCPPEVSTQHGGVCHRKKWMTGVCGNLCKCGQKGKMVCTKKPCKRSQGYSSAAAKCKVGEKKTIGCDSCECIQDGAWVCINVKCHNVVEHVEQKSA